VNKRYLISGKDQRGGGNASAGTSSTAFVQQHRARRHLSRLDGGEGTRCVRQRNLHVKIHAQRHCLAGEGGGGDASFLLHSPESYALMFKNMQRALRGTRSLPCLKRLLFWHWQRMPSRQGVISGRSVARHQAVVDASLRTPPVSQNSSKTDAWR